MILLCYVADGFSQNAVIDPQPAMEQNGQALGMLLSGASLTSSPSANTLGGFRHFSIGGWGALVRPSLDNNKLNAGCITAVLRGGLFRGVNIGPGVHGLGSTDIFLRFGTIFANGRHSDSGGFYGAGARVGILRNSILTPAISLSASYNRSSDFNLGESIYGTPAGTGRADIEVWALRIDLSKNFFIFTPSAGFGLNNARIHSSGGSFSLAADGSAIFNPAGYTARKNRMIIYGGLEWNVLILRMNIEVGHVADETFGSLGVRLTL